MPLLDSNRYHLNELDRLKYETRQRDLADLIQKLEHLKINAKTSQEILQNFEDTQQTLEYLQLEVRRSSIDKTKTRMIIHLATKLHS